MKIEDLKIGDLIFVDNCSVEKHRKYNDTELEKVGIIVDLFIDNQITFNSLFRILWENGSQRLETYGYIKNYYTTGN